MTKRNYHWTCRWRIVKFGLRLVFVSANKSRRKGNHQHRDGVVTRIQIVLSSLLKDVGAILMRSVLRALSLSDAPRRPPTTLTRLRPRHQLISTSRYSLKQRIKTRNLFRYFIRSLLKRILNLQHIHTCLVSSNCTISVQTSFEIANLYLFNFFLQMEQ